MVLRLSNELCICLIYQKKRKKRIMHLSLHAAAKNPFVPSLAVLLNLASVIWTGLWFLAKMGEQIMSDLGNTLYH